MLWHEDALRYMRFKVSRLEPGAETELTAFDCIVQRSDDYGFIYTVYDNDRKAIRVFTGIETPKKLTIVFAYLEDRYHTARGDRESGKLLADRVHVCGKPSKYDEATQLEIYYMFRRGMRVTDISRTVGIPRRTIYTIIERMQV